MGGNSCRRAAVVRSGLPNCWIVVESEELKIERREHQVAPPGVSLLKSGALPSVPPLRCQMQGLGYGILLGSTLVKVPQVVNVVRARSAGEHPLRMQLGALHPGVSPARAGAGEPGQASAPAACTPSPIFFPLPCLSCRAAGLAPLAFELETLGLVIDVT